MPGPPTSSLGLSGSNAIDGIIDLDKWGSGGAGTGWALTYSFTDSATNWQNNYGSGEPNSGFLSLNSGEKNGVAAALQSWANVSGLTFTEIFNDHQDAFNGDLRFSVWNDSDENTVAHAYLPVGSPFNSESGDVWLNSDWYRDGNPDKSPGSFLYSVFLHEIGHAIGLRHPESGPIVANSENDWLGVTVMSNRTFEGGAPISSSATRYPTTPMVNDIAAIQYMYGANTAFNAGDTVYSWSFNPSLLEAIWDGGGTDSIDWSNQNSAAVIDLNEGAWSELGNSYFVGNGFTNIEEKRTVAIAYGAIIENANGGNGDDRITGNQSDNFLRGNNGQDTLIGGAGTDTLEGSFGSDILNGGSGVDYASYASSLSSVVVDMLNVASNTGHAAFDTYQSIEGLIGTSQSDVLKGNLLANIIEGGSGNDQLIGRMGDDLLKGEDGNDTINGDDGNDVIFGGSGADNIFGLFGNDAIAGDGGSDSIDGGAGNDNITGNAGNDTILGSFGLETILGGDGADSIDGGDDVDRIDGGDENDFISGGAGNDSIAGGLGADTINGAADNDVILGGNGNDSLNGDGGNDAISGDDGNDVVLGGNNNDLLFGGQTGNDNLSGGLGDDTVFGWTGDDTINGGAGNDILRGAPLALSPTDDDRFVFTNGDFNNGEVDLLLEFNDDDTGGESLIEISGYSFTNLTDFLADPDFDIVQNGTGTDILMGAAGGKITLFNFTATGLGADDFIFS